MWLVWAKRMTIVNVLQASKAQKEIQRICWTVKKPRCCLQHSTNLVCKVWIEKNIWNNKNFKLQMKNVEIACIDFCVITY